MGRTIRIKHVAGDHCRVEDRQIRRCRITNSFGKSEFIDCICPSFSAKKKEKSIDCPSSIEIGKFDKTTNFTFHVHNNSKLNLKATLEDIKTPNVQVKIISDEFVILSDEFVTF